MFSVRRVARPVKPQGVILYRGSSLLDETPIIVVATGLARPSKNPKTGDIIQTYILADNNQLPHEAVKSGSDFAICGECPHRGTSCYVNVVQGPLAVYRAAQAGRYPSYDDTEHRALFKDRILRLGTYGDPAAVPLFIWDEVCGFAKGWRGYTHQWRTCSPEYARYCMASIETVRQRDEAKALGYRTFRVRLANQLVERGEMVCPAAAEGGRVKTCEQCRACSGASFPGLDVVIVFHGPSIAKHYKRRAYELTMTLLETAEMAPTIS